MNGKWHSLQKGCDVIWARCIEEIAKKMCVKEENQYEKKKKKRKKNQFCCCINNKSVVQYANESTEFTYASSLIASDIQNKDVRKR